MAACINGGLLERVVRLKGIAPVLDSEGRMWRERPDSGRPDTADQRSRDAGSEHRVRIAGGNPQIDTERHATLFAGIETNFGAQRNVTQSGRGSLARG